MAAEDLNTYVINPGVISVYSPDPTAKPDDAPKAVDPNIVPPQGVSNSKPIPIKSK
jgi:hypothetical protein